jgi:hypothetical protein
MELAAIKQLVEGQIEYVKIGAPDIEGVIAASAWPPHF